MPCLGCVESCLRRPTMPVTRFRRERCRLGADGFAALDAQFPVDCARLPEEDRRRCEEADRFPEQPRAARGARLAPCATCGPMPQAARPVVVRKPNWLRRGLTYAQAMADYAADNFKQASDKQQAVRRSLCAACPLNDNGACLSCGCALEKKIPIRSSFCPEGKWFRETDNHHPFSGPVTRHLIYHICPLKSGAEMWRWNINELLRRIHLFNGRRIAGIVTGPECDPPEAVREVLNPHGFECLERVNRKDRGELQTMPEMLGMVASTAADEITFYAHAKGVSRSTVATPCRQWAAMLYEACLDDIAAVERALEDFAFAGAAKSYGRFPVPWHYSGTFFWLRNERVFARPWRKFIQQRYGSEAWPGGVAAHTEAACLLLDDVPFAKLYDGGYWMSAATPALERWRLARRAEMTNV